MLITTSLDTPFPGHMVDFSLKHPLIFIVHQLLTLVAFLFRNEAQEEIFKKGQSKRIWGELYKVRL